MPSINDISKEQATKERINFIASKGCTQGSRLTYGLRGCFDELIRAKLELEMLQEATGPEVEPPPPLIIPPTYLQPSCNFTLDLAPAEENPVGSRQGRLLLVPGVSYDFLVTLAFTQNDAGAPTNFEYTKNGTPFSSHNPPSNPPNEDARTIQLSSNVTGIAQFGAKISHGAGPVKNNSNNEPDPNGQIGIGATLCGNKQIEWDYPLYFGYLSVADAVGGIPNLDDLDDFPNLVNQTQFPLQWGQLSIPYSNLGNPGYFWFAVPENLPVYTNWFQAVNNQGSVNTPGDAFLIDRIANINFGAGNVPYRIYVSGGITEGDGNYIFNQ